MVLIKYTDGSIRQGVLMAIRGAELRIAAKDAEDVLVFHLVHERWTSQNFDVVTFAFPIAVFEAVGMTPANQQQVPEEPSLLNLMSCDTGRCVN
jgi:hypothetical protein